MLKTIFADLAYKRNGFVERAFAWLNNDRRLNKDYERTIESSENLIYLVMIRRMLNRLA